MKSTTVKNFDLQLLPLYGADAVGFRRYAFSCGILAIAGVHTIVAVVSEQLINVIAQNPRARWWRSKLRGNVQSR